jgi:hypothetical protein
MPNVHVNAVRVLTVSSGRASCSIRNTPYLAAGVARETGTIGWHRLDASLPAELVQQSAEGYFPERLPDAFGDR